MNSKEKQELEGAGLPALSQAKAAMAAALANNPNDAGLKADLAFVTGVINALANPKAKTVRVQAKGFVQVDGVSFQKDQEGTITERQWHALSRHFTLVKALVAACLLGLAGTVQAATPAMSSPKVGGYDVVTLIGTNGCTFDGTTMAIAATAATNIYKVLPAIANFDYVGIVCGSSNQTTVASNNVTFHMSWSPDSAVRTAGTWFNYGDITTTNLALALSQNATLLTGLGPLNPMTSMSTLTNIVPIWFGYLCVDYATNVQNVVASNLMFKVTYKSRGRG